MNADTICFSAWLAFVVAVFADFAWRELRGRAGARPSQEGGAR